MIQTKEKWDSLALSEPTFEWYKGAMVFCVFESAISESYLIPVLFRVLVQQSRGTLITAFEIHRTVEDFTRMNQHTR